MMQTEPLDQFTLLLVDDNQTNLLLLAKIIEIDLPQVRVLTARSAREGLAICTQEPVDGAFIDVQMPEMSGLEMCRRLRQQPQTAEIPLVLITAHLASPTMRAEGLDVGAYDFIFQPISNVEMLARVKVMLRMCTDERRSRSNQQQLERRLQDHSARLRWLSGLMISGDGQFKEQDRSMLLRMAEDLADPNELDDRLFFEKLTTEFPLPWRRTVLKLALLESVPVRLAQSLSEISDIRAVIGYLERHGLVLTTRIEKETVLIIKPGARTFLRDKAEQDLTAAERLLVYQAAAEWYRLDGRFDAALNCLLDARNYSAMAQMLSQFGLALVDSHYQHKIGPLISAIPADVTAADSWLALFRGITGLSAFSDEAVDWLELAYQRFATAEDPRGMLLTATAQVMLSLTMDGCFDRWQGRLADFRKLYASSSDICAAVERLKITYALGLAELFFAGRLDIVDGLVSIGLAEAQQLCLSEQQIEFAVLRGMQALWQGRYRVVATAVEHQAGHRQNPERFSACQLLGLVGCSLLHGHGDIAGFSRQREILRSQLSPGQMQRSAFGPLLDYYQATLLLACGEKEHAAELVDAALLNSKGSSHSHQLSRLLQLRSWLHALAGQQDAAERDSATALRLREQAGGALYRIESLLFAALTCAAGERFLDAEQFLNEGLAASQRCGEERIRPGLHAWQAAIQDKLGRHDRAREQVRFFLEFQRRQDCAFFWGLIPDLLETLARLLESQAERDLFEPLLEKFAGQAFSPDSAILLCPLLEVKCLGQFRVQLQQQSFDLGEVGQASRQIFALLVAAPGQTLSIESIMATLWPDSPPSRARNSFDTAHSRLRKALEGAFGQRIRRDYLILEKGLLSLRSARIDSVLFAEFMEQARYHLQREHFLQAEHAFWKMAQIWTGEFLSGHDLGGNLALQRDHLTELRLEQISSLARLLQERRKYDEAIAILQQGLVIDPTRDSIVRRLLQLYRRRRDHRAVTNLLTLYRKALQEEDYDSEEIAELIESLEGQWVPTEDDI